MPTVRQLFALLREDVEMEAVKETRKRKGRNFEFQMNKEEPNLYEAICSSFIWEDAQKGHDYWEDIASNPPLKQQPHE